MSPEKDTKALSKELKHRLEIHCRQVRFATRDRCFNCKKIEVMVACPLKIVYKTEFILNGKGLIVGTNNVPIKVKLKWCGL